ncbi:hypothetical protein [Gordonia aichiensis]
MYRKRVAVGAALSVGHLLVLVPATATASAHEKTYDAPGGLEYTVGHGDIAARPVGALNGMPTNREASISPGTGGSPGRGRARSRRGISWRVRPISMSR